MAFFMTARLETFIRIRTTTLLNWRWRQRRAYPAGDISTLSGRPLGVPRFLWIDQNLRTPYVQTWFAGVQRQLMTNLYVETSVQSALGRKLIGTDLVNRPTFGQENLQKPADPGIDCV